MHDNYLGIVKHYENCFIKYGDTHHGVDWPNKDDAQKRYGIMLDVIRSYEKEITLLDFGCGASHLLDYILENQIKSVCYSGLDVSDIFIDCSRKKHPEITYYQEDVLMNPQSIPSFDYIVMNGVFTEKRELTYEAMLHYFKELLKTVFAKTKTGLSFNIMSKHVDWERDDLFHLSFDVLADFLCKEVSRNFIIRNDYGLYEYTVYLYK